MMDIKSRFLIFVKQIKPRYIKFLCFLDFLNVKFNENAKVEKLTKKLGKGVRRIVIGLYFCSSMKKKIEKYLISNLFLYKKLSVKWQISPNFLFLVSKIARDFQPTKTESMIISRKTAANHHPPLYLSATPIQEVSSHKLFFVSYVQ